MTAPVRTMNMIEAINDAMRVAMAADDKIIVFGEDVGFFGGVFRATAGLQAEFGKTRAFDTPITECGIIGVAVGMAAYGLRPVPEIQFADYIYPALDQLVSEAARIRYRSAGQWGMPITVRSPFGGGIFGGQTHSQSPEGIFTHVSGLKTVIPSTPYDAKGLLLAAIEDPDPVVFFEPKRIYNGPFDGHYDRPVSPWSKHAASAVPEGHYTIPLGKAAMVREGCDLTVLAYGTMVHVALGVVELMWSICAHCSHLILRQLRHRSRKRAAALWCMKRRAHLDLAQSWLRWCRNAVSTIWRRRWSV
jgi:2-oxoisovalerate dehydrogenase E1 component beta subunit